MAVRVGITAVAPDAVILNDVIHSIWTVRLESWQGGAAAFPHALIPNNPGQGRAGSGDDLSFWQTSPRAGKSKIKMLIYSQSCQSARRDFFE